MAPERDVRSRRTARAFAPGHVTGFFVPELGATDPRARGSRGAGIVLELGVVATAHWAPAVRSGLRIQSDVPGALPISRAAARALRPTAAGRLTVRLRHELPIGQGFGMSAAGALATALAVAQLSGRPRADAIEAAHLADLEGGGGLGGVSAILGGGMEVRRRAGVPPEGRIEHVRTSQPILIAVIGPPIPSPRALSDERFLARVRTSGRSALDALPARAKLPTMLELSERFTDEVELAPAPLRRTMVALRGSGAWCAQAMFGHALFAMASTAAIHRRLLVRADQLGLRAIVVRPARRGASTLAASGRPDRTRP